MTLGMFVGTYTRAIDEKGRIFMPPEWEEGIIGNGPFYLYKPPQVGFVSLVSEEHVRQNYQPLFEAIPSPISLGRSEDPAPLDHIGLLESLIGWGPNIVNISPKKKAVGMRLHIPRDGLFRTLLALNSTATMVGINDYIVMYQGDVESITAKLAGR